MNTLARLVLGLLLLSADTGSVWAQVTGAQVPENLIQKTIYVNVQHPQAADSNPGTATLPFKTVGAAAALAMANNKQNMGTRILIFPGIYREENIHLPFNTSQATGAPLVFEAQQKGQVIISGSDVWTGWTRQGTTDVYTHPWPYRWGLLTPTPWSGFQQPILRRREMIFAGGQPLEQVLSLSDLQAQVGTFYVDEAARTVSVRLPIGSTPANTIIEVSTRPILFQMSYATNVILRGLIFQHANSPGGSNAVVIGSSSHVIVDGCEFRWNNSFGLLFWATQNVTMRRSVANNNGHVGMTLSKMKNVLLEDNETSYNNWRGAKVGHYWWGFSGMKSLMIHDGVYRRHKSIGNQTNGLWFDTDNVNIVIDQARLCNNLIEGLILEANQGPITVKNSVICKNVIRAGVLGIVSSNITLEGNIIYGNGGRQINMESRDERRVTNWETGQTLMVKVEGWTLRNNAIVSVSPDWTNTHLLTPGWPHFLNSLISIANLWYNPVNPNMWLVDGNKLDLAKWRTLTKQDATSVFADPRFTDPDNCIFDLLPDSPLRKLPFLTPPSAPLGLTVTVQ